MLRIIGLTSMLFFINAWAGQPVTTKPPRVCKPSKPAGARAIRILNYNVENLFDTIHDQGKDDWEFLPKGYVGREAECQSRSKPKDQERCLEKDWTEQKLAIKLSQIKKVVDLSTTELPEIMGIVEVENPKVVRRLADELCYKEFVMTDSPDNRGIDVALMFNNSSDLKYVSHKEHMVDPKLSGKPSRNVLQVNFTAGGHPLVIFLNHWPSQAAPAPIRVAVARFLQEKVKAALSADPKATVVAMGDFNVISNDRPDPFFEVLESPNAGAARLQTVDSLWRNPLKSSGNFATLNSMPNATYFFAPEANFSLFDQFFVNQNAIDGSGLEVNVSTYRIVNPPEITTQYFYPQSHWLSGSKIAGIPKRYNFDSVDISEAGFSDHFPVMVDFKW